MNFVSLGQSDIIHVADVAMQPICSQTDAKKEVNWQAELGPATCHRCLRLMKVLREQDDTLHGAAPESFRGSSLHTLPTTP